MTMGMVGMLASSPTGSQGAEEGGHYGGAEGLTSLRRNAVVGVGGELRLDYSLRSWEGRGDGGRRDARLSDLSVRHANLRVRVDAHPNLSAFFKIDLSANSERDRDRDGIAEEALLVMRAVGGSGLGFFAGKGRAPYGQDVTLGMLQSYHHSANHADSSEGRIFIVDPPESDGAGGGQAVGPMRPGQFERAFLAGTSYEWSDRWKVEIAAFRPERGMYRDRLAAGDARDGSDIGMAGRVWWNPAEDLTIAASAVWARSSDMAETAKRTDAAAGARGEANAYAASLGIDWRRGPWRLFGEFQRGRDWNFTKGYDTAAWQAGLARDFAGGWRVSGMFETLRIDNSPAETVDDYYKLTFVVRYAFSSGLFILGEYGREWLRRDRAGSLAEKRDGDFFGVRLGWSF